MGMKSKRFEVEEVRAYGYGGMGDQRGWWVMRVVGGGNKACNKGVRLGRKVMKRSFQIHFGGREGRGGRF